MTDTTATPSCPVPQPVLPPAATLDERSQSIVDRIGHRAFYGQWGHAPEIIHGWMDFYQPIMTAGRLELRTKELCRIRVASLNGCHY